MKFNFGKFATLAVLLTISVGLYAAHALQEGESVNSAQTPLERLASQSRTAVVEQAPRYRLALQRLDQRIADYPQDFEARLLKGLIQFKAGLLDDALDELDRLTRAAPKFHLAHLVHADIMLARSRVVSDIGDASFSLGLESAKSLEQLRSEAEARLQAYLDEMDEARLPRTLLQLDSQIKHAIVVDKKSHRLYLYGWDQEQNRPRLIRNFYVSTGKLEGNKNLRGDLRTPEGVYFITRHIPDSELPDKYGVGAYPMNYPNEWDRRLGKTGYGIWLHGTETAFYSRPPLDSEGCVVLPNIDLSRAAQYLTPGQTPVIVTETIEWLDPAQWQQQREQILAALETWRTDWESGDVERYLSHYSRDFWSKSHDHASWSQRKRQVAQGKQYQRVEFSHISLFAYPSTASQGKPVVVANLQQKYRSNNFSSDMPKRLYLVQEQGRWQVLYEGRQ